MPKRLWRKHAPRQLNPGIDTCRVLYLAHTICPVDDGLQATGLAQVGGQGLQAHPRHGGVGQLSAADGLIQLSRVVQGLFGRISERHALTPVQAKLLCVLASGPKQMAELARCFGVEKAALTGLVDRAERNGLVCRSAVPGDRRALRVSLTDAGQRAAHAFHAEATEELDLLLAPLSPPEGERFRRAIAKVIAEASQEVGT
jgi:DNA-binding MarR family transcriptional regulator